MKTKIKPRKDAVVHVHGDPGRLHTTESIILTDDGKQYRLYIGENLIAECEYAKRLNDWAFSNGAFLVRHQYDLRLSDWEP